MRQVKCTCGATLRQTSRLSRYTVIAHANPGNREAHRVAAYPLKIRQDLGLLGARLKADGVI